LVDAIGTSTCTALFIEARRAINAAITITDRRYRP
jgi:hypothetical protein